MEEVECAECGNRYNSETQTFCPRCGNAGAGATPGRVDAARFDPRRRRVQMGGVILLSTSALMLVLFAIVFASAGTLVHEQGATLLQDQPGGRLDVLFTDGDVGISGASVTVLHRNGTILWENTTDADGAAGPFRLDAASVNLTVEFEGQIWRREVLVLQGDGIDVHIDVADETDGTLGAGTLVGPVRGMLGFFMAISLFVLGGGIAAVRLRQRNIAIGAGIVGLLPILILAVAVPNLATLILLVLMSLALAFIVSGRSQFN